MRAIRTFFAGEPPRLPNGQGASLWERLKSKRAAVLLGRNTIVSIFVFLVGLLLLWVLVERFGAPKLPAVGLSFLVSNTIHYAFGRAWIYRGTRRDAAAGYGFFLVNAVVGLGLTLALFAGFEALGLHYIAARVVASLFAGLVLFLLNAVLNFRSL